MFWYLEILLSDDSNDGYLIQVLISKMTRDP